MHVVCETFAAKTAVSNARQRAAEPAPRVDDAALLTGVAEGTTQAMEAVYRLMRQMCNRRVLPPVRQLDMPYAHKAGS
jgi:hypothetical protein